MNVLVTAGSGLGNVVMATPTVSAVRALGHDVWLGLDRHTAPFRSLWEGWSALQGVIVMGEKPPKIDVVVRTCWGGRGGHFNVDAREFVYAPMPFTEHHEADVDASAARNLGYCPPLPPTHVEYDGCKSVDGNQDYVVFLTACKPGKLWSRKRWPSVQWGRLADLLDMPVVFLGGEGDSRDWMKTYGLNLCGAVPIREAMGVICDARLAVAIDCGLAHCAAALSTPTLVLNGPTSHVKNRPLGPNVVLIQSSAECSPCHYTERWSTCDDTTKCMASINFDAVVQRARQMCGR